MDNATKDVLNDIQDVMIELKNDIKSLECLADLGDSGATQDRNIKLSLLIPLLDNLTKKCNQDLNKISNIINNNLQ